MNRETLEAYRTLAINGESVGMTNEAFVEIADLALSVMPPDDITLGSRVRVVVSGSFYEGETGRVLAIYNKMPLPYSVRIDKNNDVVACHRDELEVLG